MGCIASVTLNNLFICTRPVVIAIIARRCKQRINFFEGLSCRLVKSSVRYAGGWCEDDFYLWAHEIYEGNNTEASNNLPDPDFPSSSVNTNSTRKDCDEREKPFAQ
jgi:hypothetical protein